MRYFSRGKLSNSAAFPASTRHTTGDTTKTDAVAGVPWTKSKPHHLGPSSRSARSLTLWKLATTGPEKRPKKVSLLSHPPRSTHGPPSALGSLPPGKSREAGEAAACVTGMKGTLKLNSVAEEEKSKLVLDEADAPPPLVFLSAMATDPRPLRGSASPALQHWPEAGQPECHRTSASAHGGRRPGSHSGTRLPPEADAAQTQ